MEREKIYILALVLVIVALAAGMAYMLFSQSSMEYQTIAVSGGTTVEVPKTDDANWLVDDNGIRTYSAPSKKTLLTSFNSAENEGSMGAKGLEAVKDKLFTGSTGVEQYKSYNIKENTINETHYYMVYISNNETHDSILMCSENLDILKHMIDTLEFGDPNVVKDATSTTPAPKHVSKNASDKNKYSEDDLMLAAQQGYLYGYFEGYGDSYYDNYYYDDYYYDYDDYSYDDYYYDDYSGGQSSSDGGGGYYPSSESGSVEPSVEG